MGDGFELSGVVHLVRPLSVRAANLDELLLGVSAAPPSSLFYHAVQFQLRATAGDEVPHDDFSNWVNGVVEDRETAERLSFTVQSAGQAEVTLRAGMLKTLRRLPEETRRARAAPPGGEFVFLAADSVPAPTDERAEDAAQLMEGLARADASVWFYHFIEQPWYEPGEPPPIRWLRARDESGLADGLAEAVRSGRPLEDIRRRFLERWRRRDLRRRVAASVARPEGERIEAGREAVAGLVRRLKRHPGTP